MGRIRHYFSLILFSNIFIGLGAVALTIASLNYFGYPWNNLLPLLIFIFSATVLVYSYHSIQESSMDGNSNRESWIKNNIKLLKYLSAFIALIGSTSLFFIQSETVFALTLLGFLSIFYTKPFRIGSARFRFKENKYFKVVVIALVWAVTTVMIPFIELYGYNNSLLEMLPLFFQRFLLIFALSIPFDIRDIKKDSLAGRETIATAFGPSFAKKIAFIGLIGFSLLEICVLVPDTDLLILIPASFFLISSSNLKGDYFYNFFGDGLLILYSFLCILVI